MNALFVFLAIGTQAPDLAQVPSLVAQARAKEAQKDWVSAAHTWEQLTTVNPTRAGYWLGAGNDYYNAKDYTKAIANFEKADELGVSYKWDMPYVIACCYALTGNKEKAITNLASAIDLGYRDLGLVQTDKDLESLHADPRFVKLAALADVAKMDRIEGYRYDLWLLNRELRRMHFSPFRIHSREEVDRFVAGLNSAIPKLSDAQIAVKFKELAAMMGDGHTHVTTPYEIPDAKKGLPVTFMTFKEGMFVISADAGHQDLLGCQLLKIGDHPLDMVLEAVKPICSYDNTQWIVAREPSFLRLPVLLNALGLIPEAGKATLTLRDPSGVEKVVTLPGNTDANGDGWKFARNLSPNPVPLTFVHRDKNYWFELLPDSKTVFFQYNAVVDMPDESLAKFSQRLFKFIEEHEVDRLIIDMRWNGGGNNFLNRPLLDGLIKCKINVPGKLFVIIGRNTFSAAICGATQIERYTNAIFAGEASGSSPNFIGESIPIHLPYSKMVGTVSDLYWENSTAMDHRVWISPTIYVPPTFADYASNRDPVIDAILNYPEAGF